MNGLKELQFINQDKMRFDSGNKTFDNQTNYIGTGNVIANTQCSSYIKDLVDLKPFGRLPLHVKAFVIAKLQENEQVILYQFHHLNGRKLVVHGWILTAPDNKVLGYFPQSMRKKSLLVMKEAIKYIGWGY